MKKLLNNPLFVGALGVAAMAFAAWNIVLPMYGGGAALDTASIPSIGNPFEAVVGRAVQAADTAADHEQDSRTSASLSSIGWNQKPLRDPFRLKTENNNEAIDIGAALAKNISESADESTDADVIVEALVIGKSFRLAVVDGQIIKEGNQVANARVDAVTPDAIQIVANDGTMRTVSIGDDN